MEQVMKESTYRIYIAVFFAAIFIFLFLSVVTFKQITDLSNTQFQVERTVKVQQQTEELLSDLLNAETGQRGYLLIRDSVYLKPYFAAEAKIEAHLTILTELTSHNRSQQRRIAILRSYNKQRLLYLSDILNDYAPDGTFTNYSKTKMYLGMAMMDSCRMTLQDIKKESFKRLNESRQRNREKIRSTSIFTLIAMLVSLLIILIAFYKIDFDLCRMRKILKSLNIANEKLNVAQRIGNIGQWVWNIDKNQIFNSDQHYRQLGYQPNEYEPTLESFVQMVHPEDTAIVAQIAESIKSAQEHEPILYRIYKKDGSIIYLQTMYHFTTDDNGDRIAVGVNMDVTKDVVQTNNLAMHNEHLIKANSELSSFNYIASHDLQEPLRKIQMFISRIDTDDKNTLSTLSATYFDKIKNAANRMQVLINDLLAFSRLNKTDKVMETINLNEIFEHITQEWAQTIEEKKAVIHVAAMSEVKGVPFLIQTLFSNLIGNSLKYSKTDQAPVIDVTYEKITGRDIALAGPENEEIAYHKISIHDNGIGFQNEFAVKIFELFQRLHDKQSFAGTGIGLAICKKIVESHDGFIEATGKPNKGATFTVYLPIVMQ